MQHKLVIATVLMAVVGVAGADALSQECGLSEIKRLEAQLERTGPVRVGGGGQCPPTNLPWLATHGLLLGALLLGGYIAFNRLELGQPGWGTIVAYIAGGILLSCMIHTQLKPNIWPGQTVQMSDSSARRGLIYFTNSLPDAVSMLGLSAALGAVVFATGRAAHLHYV